MDNQEKLDKFKEIYVNLVNTLEYNEEEEDALYLSDCLDELSAYEMREKSIKRTIGGSFIFSLRVSKELDILGIENYLVEYEKEDKTYWGNLYKIDDIWYIADLTAEIVAKDYSQNNNRNIEEKNRYADIYAIDFLFEKMICQKLEEIKDDGKKIGELKKKPIHFVDIAEDTVNQEVDQSIAVVQDKITFAIILQKLIINIKSIPETIKKMKQDKEEGKGILVKIENFLKDALNKVKNIYEDIEEKMEDQLEEEKLKEVENRKNNFKEELKVEDIELKDDIEESELSQIEKNSEEKSERED